MRIISIKEIFTDIPNNRRVWCEDKYGFFSMFNYNEKFYIHLVYCYNRYYNYTCNQKIYYICG